MCVVHWSWQCRWLWWWWWWGLRIWNHIIPKNGMLLPRKVEINLHLSIYANMDLDSTFIYDHLDLLYAPLQRTPVKSMFLLSFEKAWQCSICGFLGMFISSKVAEKKVARVDHNMHSMLCHIFRWQNWLNFIRMSWKAFSE